MLSKGKEKHEIKIWLYSKQITLLDLDKDEKRNK